MFTLNPKFVIFENIVFFGKKENIVFFRKKGKYLTEIDNIVSIITMNPKSRRPRMS